MLINVNGKISHAHSFCKAISWRVLGSVDTFLLGFVITGHLASAGAIASTEVLTKTLLYYLHERGWNFLATMSLRKQQAVQQKEESQ